MEGWMSADEAEDEQLESLLGRTVAMRLRIERLQDTFRQQASLFLVAAGFALTLGAALLVTGVRFGGRFEILAITFGVGVILAGVCFLVGYLTARLSLPGLVSYERTLRDSEHRLHDALFAEEAS